MKSRQDAERRHPSVDFGAGALEAFLRSHFGDGKISLERTGGGQSNPTYFVDYGDGRMVLRKKPTDPNPARRPRYKSRIPRAQGARANQRAGAATDSLS